MGNRAIVAFQAEPKQKKVLGVYFHWNGGPESVYPFLDALDKYEVRGDGNYEVARFVQIVGNFMRGTLSLGIEIIDLAAAESQGYVSGWDNGLYVVNRSGEHRTVRRKRYVQGALSYQERWLTSEEVEIEREAAYRHSYNKPGSDNMANSIAKSNDAFFASQGELVVAISKDDLEALKQNNVAA